ncbi:hypothetical protein [Stenotrophomonas sp. AB1(2024)]|jgi:hypothetical protein|uniref:hypothetical protein n=1 Tax=Stenotrophomonas sp. AB1(2024) TaxID=3132215 RepID=UPI003099A454
MIEQVAKALGSHLRSQVAFIGGSTTGLQLTDPLALQNVRHTKDVDLIVPVMGRVDWQHLQEKLRSQGFHDNLHEEAPACALFLGDLRVDFMPYDATILGFSNQWYERAMATARPVTVGETEIRLVTPEYFLATKLDAYNGRGKGDIWSSTDIEDIITLFQGRPEIVAEVLEAPQDVREFIQRELNALLEQDGLQYAVESAASDRAQRDSIYSRMEKAAGH